jgi:signal transduction histidine kinase
MQLKHLQNIILFLLTLFVSINASSQGDVLAGLEMEAMNATSDTGKIRLYNEISLNYATIDPNKGIEYGHKALVLATTLNDRFEIAWSNANIARSYDNLNIGDSSIKYIRRAYGLIKETENTSALFAIIILYGNSFMDVSDYDSAAFYYNQALDIATQTDNKARLAAAYNNLAIIYQNKGNLKESYEYYLRALNNFEVNEDLNNQAITLNNIALINQELGHYETAVKYLLMAVEINKSIGDNYNLSMNYNNIGVAYKELENYEMAFDYYDKSNAIAEEFGFHADLARNYHNIGNLHKMNGDMDKALESFNHSLEISIAQGLKVGMLYNDIAICEVLIEQDKIREAWGMLNEINRVIGETGRFTFKENYYFLQSLIAEKEGDYNSSLVSYKKYTSFKDSLLELKNQRQIEEIQEKYETEKKAIENKKLRELNQANSTVIYNQRLFGVVVILSLMLAMIYAVSIYRSRQKLKRTYQSLKELNDEVISQKKQLEESNRTKDRMFSIIAHDLRSPFSAMMGFLQMITEDYKDFDDQQKLEMLRLTYEQSLTTFGLMENLLQWSLSQRGMVDNNPEDVNLCFMIENQIEVFRHQAESKELTIENLVQKDLSARVDEDMTKTIFRNLISNAIKFTPRQGKIVLSSSLVDSKILIKVSDSGSGMPADKIENFLNHGKIESTKGTENESGTGLGLEIVKDFARRMQVQMYVESRSGFGTEFTLCFPKAV